jgi:hypothetical protein
MRFSVEPNGHEHFKFVVHDSAIEEPIAWCMTETDCKLIVEALNEKHGPWTRSEE